MRRKKEIPPKPPGCRICKGQPWVTEENGLRRCKCPRGVWFKQQERAHLRNVVGQIRWEAL